MKSLAMLVGTMLLVIGFAAGQEKTASQQQPASNVHQSSARETYRLDYTITEMEDGKKINARTYSVTCEDEGSPTRGNVKVGSRVPVATGGPAGGSMQFTYLDVGVNIEARLTNLADGSLSLQSEIEMSSVADTTAIGEFREPVIRQLKASTNNSIPVGKPIVISSADDITSHRQFQVQVVATKLK